VRMGRVRTKADEKKEKKRKKVNMMECKEKKERKYTPDCEAMTPGSRTLCSCA
jgi:hypothetical protein